MAFIDETIVIGDVTYWPFPAVPVEVEDSAAARAEGVLVQLLDKAGNAPVTCLTTTTRDPVTSLQTTPAFGESPLVFGAVPPFYAPTGTIMYRSSVMDHFITSPAYYDLAALIEQAVADLDAAKAEIARLTADGVLVDRVAALEAAGPFVRAVAGYEPVGYGVVSRSAPPVEADREDGQIFDVVP